MTPGGLPPDDYFCNYVLKVPRESFISFSVGAPFVGSAQKQSWHTNVDDIAGHAIGIGWTSSNLNHPWSRAAGGSRIAMVASIGGLAASRSAPRRRDSGIGIWRSSGMIKTVCTPAWLAFKRIILAIGIVGALHAMTMTGAASTSCSAVNSGSFNLTNPAFDLGNTGTLSDWTVGDRIAATFTDAVGFSHLDGFFSGTPPAAIGTLNQVTVPSGSSATIMHTVVSADIANGILLDPENNDSVSATCVAALILTSTPSSTTKIGQTYFQTNVASGGTPAYTFSLFAGSLPSGTSLDTSTGLVSGPLTAAGTFNYTIKVTDSSPTPALTATQVIA